MTPNTALPVEESTTIQPSSTAGMTTKVVKGSAWTLAGQLAPFAVSFFTTPFVIRFLGSESYGVLILIGLIPAYFSFADLGMGIASTRFASEAHGQGDVAKERNIIWTAATVAAVSSLTIVLPIFFLSDPIVVAFNVPEHLVPQASIALKIATVAFAVGLLASIFNAPMLARLRMDLNTLTQAGSKILLAAFTPLILYFGGGIVGAVSWSLIVAGASLAVVFYVSSRLLEGLLPPRFDTDILKPMLRVGGAWFIAVIAAVLIGNLERFVLTSRLSVEALAYYSIAFTFANLANVFSQAMLQSLLPAFSQLLSSERRQELQALFSRGIRLSIVALLPFTIFLFLIGKPFLTLWAGEQFGNESTIPFYILLFGFFLTAFSPLPYSVLLASGRTDYFAKMYWIELPLYGLLAWALISYFGIVGAAAAYAIRNVFEGVWANILCHRLLRLDYGLSAHLGSLLAGLLVLLPIVAVVALVGPSLVLIVVSFVSFGCYAIIVWRKLLEENEKVRLVARLGRAFKT